MTDGNQRKGITLRSRLAIGLLVGLLGCLFLLGPAGRSLEEKGLDLLFVLRGPLSPPENIVIVAVDEISFAELGLQWPWPRSLHARLIDRLRVAGARVIAFDVLFDAASRPHEDTVFATALTRAGNVVLAGATHLVETHNSRQILRVTPLPIFERAALAVGLVNLAPEKDKVIRRGRLSFGGSATFAHAVAKAMGWKSRGEEVFLINHLGPAPAIFTTSYVQALTPGALPDKIFQGKIVLVGRAVGATEPAVADAYFTPYFLGSRTLTPGVEIHASIIDTLLQNHPIRVVGPVLWFLWNILWSLLAALVVGHFSPWLGFGVTLGLVGVNGFSSLLAFSKFASWLPWVVPALSMTAIHAVTVLVRWRQTEREKVFLRDAFQHYVDPVVVQQIVDHPEELRLGGKSMEGTVLFSDLQGFTHIAEGLSPEALVSFLNDYFSAMSEIILAHHGMLNRTIGDGILALWGAPLASPTHGLDACKAALMMQKRLESLNQDWVTKGLPQLKMRIGLQTGPIVVGNIGAAGRFDYTAVGDTVNVASRLEGVNKVYNTGIIIGEDTARCVADSLELRELDILRVVGRDKPLRVYECVAENGDISDDQRSLLELFQLGLTAYHKRDWVKALSYFERAHSCAPQDGPSRVYLERSRCFVADPPPNDWDGVYTAT